MRAAGSHRNRRHEQQLGEAHRSNPIVSENAGMEPILASVAVHLQRILARAADFTCDGGGPQWKRKTLHEIDDPLHGRRGSVQQPSTLDGL